MKTSYAFALLSYFAASAPVLHAQVSLDALDTPVVIDFLNPIPGVNNGPFDALMEAGADPAGEGQLDLNAWDYFVDGASAAALGAPSVFPGTLPMGNGFRDGGDLATGLNATQITGSRAIGIQPTGGHFSAGNITLRVQNNTGSALEQLAVAYSVGVFNDLDRSNSFTLYWSASNAQDSYQPIAASAIVSPATMDAAPEWVIAEVDVPIILPAVAAGGFVYLRWVGDDVTGSGQRDEFALANISITARSITGPVLIPSASLLPAFAQTLGTPSAAQSFTLSASNLLDDVIISASAPYEVSLNEAFGFGSSVEVGATGGTLAALPIYVRLNNTVVGASAGTVDLASLDALPALVSLSGATSSGTLSLVYINELLASNATGITDPNGEFDDWIELYNPGVTDLDLAGWYLTDNLGQLTKYQFPIAGTEAVVPAQGWLLIWADNQTAQGDLHTNFALSSVGEAVALVGPDGVSIADQIEFGLQAADVSYGRQSDGGSPWVEFGSPTPNASNTINSIGEFTGLSALRAWPVPTSGASLFLDRLVNAEIFDMEGRSVLRIAQSNVLNIGPLHAGVYLLRSDEGAVLRFVKQ